ncbi:MAG TPA: FimV/HubP family polar landmark protein [Steroidobacteraceae bacterium]|nr:FimV/HubP family polar landmark protein [Steroidobacteraceae bacterium]
MIAKSLKWALATLALSPAAALALGLGDIHLNSTLNAPFDADIEVIGATPDQLTTLKPAIASRELFAQNGLDYPAFLQGVTLAVVHTQDGRDVIRMKSQEAVTDPFVTFLVELDWARGRYVHEYTVLLDPPVYTPNQNAANTAPVAPAAVSTGTREGAVERAPSQAATAAAAPPSEASAPAAAGAESYTVRRGDALSKLASRMAPGSADEQRRWMVATFQANPSAFEKDNMNLLRSGSVLRVPDQSAVSAVPASAAVAEVHRQYAAWRAAGGGGTGSEPGRLRLVAPAESPTASGPAGAAGTGTNSQLQAKVNELQAQLDESRRLLDLKNKDLADLQAKLAASQGKTPAVAPTPAPPPAPAPSAQTPAPSEAATPPPAANPPAETTAAQPPPPAPAPTPAVKKPIATHAPAAEEPSFLGSILDTVKGLWWVIALVIVAIAAVMGLRAWRARQASGFDDSLGKLAAAGAESLSHDREPSFTSTNPQIKLGREDNFLVEESGSHERPRLDPAVVSGAAPRHVPSDETISSETAINLDQGDPLAEADFHMAYGLYDQAADLVRIAIQREPNRRDLKLKLLEVFFVWGNKDQFLQTARELAESRAQAPAGEWDKIVIMGKQLAPNDPLFSGAGGVSGAAAAGVDLDLQGGESRVDFDILGEPVAMSSDNVDLDIGTAIGERDPTAEAAAQQATDKNLALHEDTVEREAQTGSTREMTTRIPGGPRSMVDDPSADVPTVEQPTLQMSSQPTIRQKVETALKHGAGGEHTTELAIDDLGLDLTALDAPEQPVGGGADAPTMVAGLDEHSRRIMETAEQRAMNGGGDLKASETGSWHFEGSELGDVAATQVTPPPAMDESSATSRLKALKSGGTLDFDIGSAEQAAAPTNGAGGEVDLDVGTATVPDAVFTATQRLGSEELALPDLEPVTMSEVGTKLDLARAYMDMGDPEGARNILEEVMHEGSVAQKQEAQRLIASLPGA